MFFTRVLFSKHEKQLIKLLALHGTPSEAVRFMFNMPAWRYRLVGSNQLKSSSCRRGIDEKSIMMAWDRFEGKILSQRVLGIHLSTDIPMDDIWRVLEQRGYVESYHGVRWEDRTEIQKVGWFVAIVFLVSAFDMDGVGPIVAVSAFFAVVINYGVIKPFQKKRRGKND